MKQKRLFPLLLLILLIVFFTGVPALAANGANAAEGVVFSTAGDLFQHWHATRASDETSPYPSYICGVYSSDGTGDNLTFAVTKDEAGERGKEEILALVTDDSTVSFAYQTYSYEQLWAIQQELNPLLGEGTGANSLGIDEMNNVLIIGLLSENENAQAFMAECFQAYGNMVAFEENDGIYHTYLEDSLGSISGGDSGFWTLLIVFAAAMGLILLFVLRQKLVPALQTNTGSTIASAHPLQTHQIVPMVKDTSITPSSAVDDAILSKIETL